MNHYRCYRCFLPRSGREIITNTIKFVPHKIQFSIINCEKKLQNIFVKILVILQTNNVQLPIAQNKQQVLQQAFNHLAKVLNNHRLPNSIQPSQPSQQQLKNQWSYSAAPPRVQIQSKPTKPPILSLMLTHNNQGNPQKIVPPKNPHADVNMMPVASRRLMNDCGNNRSTITHNLFHIFDNSRNKLNIDALLQNRKTQKIWSRSLDNELGRLTQGFQKQVKGTDSMVFISKKKIPQNRKVTYSNFVCDYRPLKSETFRVKMTVGGHKLDYPDETASPVASLIETKLIINSVISDHANHNSKFCAIDLKDFFSENTHDQTRISTNIFTIFIFRFLY